MLLADLLSMGHEPLASAAIIGYKIIFIAQKFTGYCEQFRGETLVVLLELAYIMVGLN